MEKRLFPLWPWPFTDYFKLLFASWWSFLCTSVNFNLFLYLQRLFELKKGCGPEKGCGPGWPWVSNVWTELSSCIGPILSFARHKSMIRWEDIFRMVTGLGLRTTPLTNCSDQYGTSSGYWGFQWRLISWGFIWCTDYGMESMNNPSHPATRVRLFCITKLLSEAAHGNHCMNLHESGSSK